MVGRIIENKGLRDLKRMFLDRNDAGSYLARALEPFRGTDALVLAIPSGGVPVGITVARQLDLPLDVLIIRKLPVPGNPEAGFGAMSLEGDLLLNEPMVNRLGITPEEIDESVQIVREQLQERNHLFRADQTWPQLQGRTVILVDDGLASGYTMLAAARMVRKRQPAQLIVAVPTAPLQTVEMLAQEVDQIYCLNIRTETYFAVASAYRNWYDLAAEEVVRLLAEYRKEKQ